MSVLDRTPPKGTTASQVAFAEAQLLADLLEMPGVEGEDHFDRLLSAHVLLQRIKKPPPAPDSPEAAAEKKLAKATAATMADPERFEQARIGAWSAHYAATFDYGAGGRNADWEALEACWSEAEGKFMPPEDLVPIGWPETVPDPERFVREQHTEALKPPPPLPPGEEPLEPIIEAVVDSAMHRMLAALEPLPPPKKD